jgi:hypothetical protein
MITVTFAHAIKNYHLELGFNTGETGVFDMRPYLDKGVFTQLKDVSLFNNIKIQHRTVTWCDGELDMSPDTLYIKSVKPAS